MVHVRNERATSVNSPVSTQWCFWLTYIAPIKRGDPSSFTHLLSVRYSKRLISNRSTAFNSKISEVSVKEGEDILSGTLLFCCSSFRKQLSTKEYAGTEFVITSSSVEKSTALHRRDK